MTLRQGLKKVGFSLFITMRRDPLFQRGPCLPALGEQRGQSCLSHGLSPAPSSSSELCLIYSAGGPHTSEFPREEEDSQESIAFMCYNYYPSPLFVKKSQLFFSFKVSARSSHITLPSPKRCRQSPVERGHYCHVNKAKVLEDPGGSWRTAFPVSSSLCHPPRAWTLSPGGIAAML